MWRVNRIDAAIWLVTMATSALINTELGLLVGVLVSAFCVLGRTQCARALEMGQAGHRDLFKDMDSYKNLHRQPGVAVFRYEAPIYYANQSLFKKSLYRSVGLDPQKEKARLKKQETQPRKESSEVSTVTFHTVILDCSAVLFLDTAGVRALKDVRKDYKEFAVRLLLAQCSTSVMDSLRRGGYYDPKSTEIIFHTLTDAIHHAQSGQTQNGDCETRC